MTSPSETPLDLDAIEARANAATAGPWHSWDRGIGFEVHTGAKCFADIYESDEQCWELNGGMRETFEEGDAEFIAHAREDVPALVRRIRELEARPRTVGDLTARDLGRRVRIDGGDEVELDYIENPTSDGVSVGTWPLGPRQYTFDTPVEFLDDEPANGHQQPKTGPRTDDQPAQVESDDARAEDAS